MIKEEVKPVGYDESLKLLRDETAFLGDLALRRTCGFVLGDERFLEAPAAAKKHQAYVGGLVCHTAEVLRIALATAKAAPAFDKDVLVASVIWHDYGKIWDYQKLLEGSNTGRRDPNILEELNVLKDTFGYTRHRWTIRHLSRSYGEFLAAAARAGVSEDLKEKVGHCILSHHGRQEWGSPVTPMTIEAFIIHAADTISARFTERENLFERGPDASWKDDPSRLA